MRYNTAIMVENTPEESKPAPSEPSDNEGIIHRLRVWLGANISGRQPEGSLKAALEELLEDHKEEGAKLPPEEQSMLKKVLGFGVLEVSDIMTPRSDIKAVEYSVSLPDLTRHLIEYEHTRVPVYNDTLDNIKGFVHIKDLLPYLSSNSSFNMALVLRDVLFIPPSMKLSNLLIRMRGAGVHMAIVIDEYGGTDGLVTLEDIFEEIVGEIQDEHDGDENEALVTWSEHGFCDVDARTRIEKLEKDLGLSLSLQEEEGEYDTLAGFLLYLIDHVPVKGEKVEYQTLRFEIRDADPRTIKTVRIYRPVESR